MPAPKKSTRTKALAKSAAEGSKDPPKSRGGGTGAAPRGGSGPDGKNALIEAAEDAQRSVLLAELLKQGWNMSATARALRLHGPSAVIRYLKSLGLADQYDAAKARGDIAPGRPT